MGYEDDIPEELTPQQLQRMGILKERALQLRRRIADLLEDSRRNMQEDDKACRLRFDSHSLSREPFESSRLSVMDADRYRGRMSKEGGGDTSTWSYGWQFEDENSQEIDSMKGYYLDGLYQKDTNAKMRRRQGKSHLAHQ